MKLIDRINSFIERFLPFTEQDAIQDLRDRAKACKERSRELEREANKREKALREVM